MIKSPAEAVSMSYHIKELLQEFQDSGYTVILRSNAITISNGEHRYGVASLGGRIYYVNDIES